MILLVHLLFGAAVGSTVKNVPAAIFLAFLSHYFLDAFPHVEYNIENITKKQWQKSTPAFLKVFLDFCLGILFIFLSSKNQPIIYIYGIVAILPDGLTFLNSIISNNFLTFLSKIHEKIHFLKYKKISNFWRITSQVLAVIASIIIFKI